MAKLILTEEEKKTLTFLEWDDASLGKAVKKVGLIIQDESGEDALPATAAAVWLITRCLDNNADYGAITVKDLTDGGKDMGDWKITCVKQDSLDESEHPEENNESKTEKNSA